jgi:glutamine amidotransferase PdxT
MPQKLKNGLPKYGSAAGMILPAQTVIDSVITQILFLCPVADSASSYRF